MNYLLILKLMGLVLKTEAALMVLPIIISFLYQTEEDPQEVAELSVSASLQSI